MRKSGINILWAFLILPLFVRCGNHGDHEGHDDHDHNEAAQLGKNENNHDESEDHHEEGEIVFAEAKAKEAGVVCTEIRSSPVVGIIPVSGRIMPASGEEATVAATASGIVRLNRELYNGATVGKGAAIATISSANLPEGDISARVSLAYQNALKEYERGKKLVEAKLMPEKEFNILKNEYENAKIAYDAVGKYEKGGITVTSPISGYITDILVTEGDYAEVGQPLIRVSGNRNLYLKADLPEKYFKMTDRIVSAKFKPAYSSEIYDLAKYNGRLLTRGRTSDGNGYIPLTFEFNNTGGVIPGAYAKIYLVTSDSKTGIMVPDSAISEEQGEYFIYIRVDDNCYKKQNVRLGITDGEKTEIISGLHPGQVIVTQGVTAVKLAGASGAVPGHTHNH